ncbi:Mechanosensitive ion channel [Halogranum gelatinilyticum]|uniref:Mechanosensitive ion channel n=1 Tax=Halogranum gelatinilyticum TaxID=660521 RepID=A0A1G9RHH8_9EURY|nr:mechanosensitive ion channel family protein [Halogranum gelatinilyticum]SDM22653.1 Mechanosensitive ion channel [Halogranum gelatinilyticum]
MLQTLSFLESLTSLEATAVVLALSLGSAILLEFVVLRFVRSLVTETNTEFDNILFQELRIPIVVTAALAGVFVLTRLPAIASSTVFTEEELRFFFDNPALTVIVLVWAWALNQVVNRFVEAVKDKGSRYDFAPVFSNVWTLVVLVAAAGVTLRIWGVEITPLLGAAGIVGITVGFAAKDTVANFFGGIALYFDDTYKMGDFIELDSGEAGSVVKLGIRSTMLLTRDEVLITVPNSVLNSAKIVNRSAPQTRKRIRVPIGVGYGTDLDEFEALLVDIAFDEKLTLDSPKPRMRFRRFGDSAVEYELLCWVDHPTKEARAIHFLNRAIYDGLNDAGIEIPYPKRDLAVRFDGDAPRPAAAVGPESTDGGEWSGDSVGDSADRAGDGDSADRVGNDGSADRVGDNSADRVGDADDEPADGGPDEREL